MIEPHYFAGECFGGPYDGTELASAEPAFEVLIAPPFRVAHPIRPDDPAVSQLPARIGRYRWDGNGWRWTDPPPEPCARSGEALP